MASNIDQFAKAIIAAKVLTTQEIKSLWDSIPASSRPKQVPAFAQLLIEQKILTPFQAEELQSPTGVPLILGDYKLLHRIGAGGMGQVFQGEHRYLKRQVAIKLLSADISKDPDSIKRFQREVEAAARLSHPNIVQTFDASVQNGTWYLVMELVQGSNLADVMTSYGRLEIQHTLDYLGQAAAGLAYAHAKGIVHRDIKPSNLLLSREGVVKVLDLGLARIDDGQLQHSLTESGQVMGSVDFMAPEQALDVRHVDGRVDIYSLGCSLFCLLTGRNVYSEDTAMQKLLAHQNNPIPSLQAIRPDVSPALARTFERMVAKRREDRYQTMNEVCAEFSQHLAALATLPAARINNVGTSPYDPTAQKLDAATRSFSPGQINLPPGTMALGVTPVATLPLPTESVALTKDTPAIARRGRLPGTLALFGAVVAGLLAVAVVLWFRNGAGEDALAKNLPEQATTTPAIKPAADYSRVAATPEFALAKWIFSKRGLIDLVPGTPPITNEAELPTEPFDITMVQFNLLPVIDADIARLEGLPKLLTLRICGTKITDQALEHVGRINCLTWLSADDNAITDRGLNSLKNLPSLRQIELANTQISDDGLAALSRMQTLRAISLNETNITDKGLVHLYDLKGLVLLDLSHTEVTKAGIKELRLQLPLLKIEQSRQIGQRGQDWTSP